MRQEEGRKVVRRRENSSPLQIEELDRKILRSAINRVNEERKNLRCHQREK